MKLSKIVMLAAFVAMPAAAEEIQFEGRTVEIAGDSASPTILRMTGSRYGINADSARILDKAQACISRTEGVSTTSVDAGVLSARVQADYRALFSSRSIRSQMTIEATDGYFSISQSDLGYSPAASADTPQDGYAPLLQSGAGWDNALESAVKIEDGIVDCLYR